MARYLFVSPHPDDAVLSAGGLIAKLARAGHEVRVVTVFSRCPDEATRQREDIASIELLGAERIALGMVDLVERRPVSRGAPAMTAADLPVIDELREALTPLARGATVIGPLGVALHPDHQIGFAACAGLDGEVAFYEDVPYALCPHATARRLAVLGVTTTAATRNQLIERVAMARWWMARPVMREVVPAPIVPLAAWIYAGGSTSAAPALPVGALAEERHDVTETFGAKMSAIARYDTQWPRFYRSLSELRGALAAHAWALGSPFVIERLFRRADGGAARQGTPRRDAGAGPDLTAPKAPTSHT